MQRLDDAARVMNPFLAAVAVMLMLLNFVYAVRLINWQVLPQTPSAATCPVGAAAAGVHPSAAKPAAISHPIAASAN